MIKYSIVTDTRTRKRTLPKYKLQNIYFNQYHYHQFIIFTIEHPSSSIGLRWRIQDNTTGPTGTYMNNNMHKLLLTNCEILQSCLKQNKKKPQWNFTSVAGKSQNYDMILTHICCDKIKCYNELACCHSYWSWPQSSLMDRYNHFLKFKCNITW